MKIISLGCTCYIKNLIKNTTYDKSTDIVDWVNSFEFDKLVEVIDKKINIFENTTNSIDLKTNITTYYNEQYLFRMPHEIDIEKSIITYQKHLDQFFDYKNDTDNYLFIRQLNLGQLERPAEILENNYNEETYNKLMLCLPVNSKILLITNKKLLPAEKNKIFDKFYVLDNIIRPDHIAYGDYLPRKKEIVGYYQDMFDNICNNFDNVDNNIIYNLVKNENIGL